jgi:hypothetical protein
MEGSTNSIYIVCVECSVRRYRLCVPHYIYSVLVLEVYLIVHVVGMYISICGNGAVSGVLGQTMAAPFSLCLGAVMWTWTIAGISTIYNLLAGRCGLIWYD